MKGMRRYKWGLVIFVLLVVSLLAGCTETYDVAMKLKHSDVPVKRTTGDGLVFENEVVAITISPVLNTAILFELENKSPKSLRLIWDETVFLNVNGSVSPVMHAGVKYIDRNESQPPTMIPAGSFIRDQIVPTDNVYYSSGPYGGWNVRPIVPANSNALEYDGRSIGMVLVLETEGTKYEYRFDFELVVRQR